MSPAVTDMLGYTIEEALALDYMECMHPDDRVRSRRGRGRADRRAASASTNFESRFRHKDGSYRVLSWRSKPRGDLMYATARDVTDAAAAARALREAKEQLEVRVERAHARAGAGQRIAAQERAPLPRAHRARLRQHRADRRRQPDPLPEPRGDQRRGLPARGVVRPPRHRAHASRRPAGARRSGREAAGESRQADPGDLAPPPQGRPLDLARRRRHQPARRSVRGRHRHQLPRHHRAAASTKRGSASSCSASRCCRASRAPSASARTCAASSRWWCAASKRSCRSISAASACTTWARTGSP